MRRSVFLVALIIVVASCDLGASPDELEHTHILAVRADPPGIQADQNSRIDVLATSSEGVLLRPIPTTAEFVTQIDGATLSRPATDWVVQAPSEEQLAAARIAAEIAPDAPLPIIIRVTVDIDGQTLSAEKVIVFGLSYANPTILDALLEDEPLGDAELVVQPDRDVTLSASTDPATGLRFAWASGVGGLSGYRTDTATLTPDNGKSGAIVVIARDETGGVTWRSGNVRVE